MAYKTRSDTLKLQRLIDVLKERGNSETAINLETSASDFLNDVKVRTTVLYIPYRVQRKFPDYPQNIYVSSISL